jgi:hypothetical protein
MAAAISLVRQSAWDQAGLGGKKEWREREREREREKESPGIEEGGRSPSNSPILAKEPFSLKKDKNFFP